MTKVSLPCYRQWFGQQRQPRRRHHRPAAAGNHRRRIGRRQTLLAGDVVGRGEYLQRPGNVEQLHIGEREHMNGFRHFGVIRGVIGVYAKS
jgi:hypothetical protein